PVPPQPRVMRRGIILSGLAGCSKSRKDQRSKSWNKDDHSFWLLDSSTISVSWHVRINLFRPLIDPAVHALGLRKALLAQPARDSKAAATQMTVHDNTTSTAGFKFAQPFGNFAHWQQNGLSNQSRRMLVHLAAIEQKHVVLCVQHSLDLAAVNLDWQVRH